MGGLVIVLSEADLVGTYLSQEICGIEVWLPPTVAAPWLSKRIAIFCMWQIFCFSFFSLTHNRNILKIIFVVISDKKKWHLWLYLQGLAKCLISADSEVPHQFTSASSRIIHAWWTEETFVLFYLRILDISFNVLRHIEGLDRLAQLKKLFLVNNKISKIENLSNLQMLQMLELGSNRIRVGLLYKMLAGEFCALWLGISLFWKCASLIFLLAILFFFIVPVI